MAEQAKILVADAEENNLAYEVLQARWAQWDNCSLCEQRYHGVVACALSWACWKTYLGHLKVNRRIMAMSMLGIGLSDAKHYADALSVREVTLSTMRRLGAAREYILVAQCNLANSYLEVGRHEDSLIMRQEVYSGKLKLYGKEHRATITEANNYALSLLDLQRDAEAKSLLREMLPVARRVLGDIDEMTLSMRWMYAAALFRDDNATPDDRREAVTKLEELERIARRVLGPAHPLTKGVERSLRHSRAALSA